MYVAAPTVEETYVAGIVIAAPYSNDFLVNGIGRERNF
jgi:hypothetical protein